MRFGDRFTINCFRWDFKKSFMLDIGLSISNFSHSPRGIWLDIFFGFGCLGIMLKRLEPKSYSSMSFDERMAL